MKKPISSILGLMALILIMGVGLAALKNPDKYWASLLFAATIASLLTSILGTILRRRSSRAFWIGFSVFGWGYLVMNVFCASNPTDLTIPAGALFSESLFNKLNGFEIIKGKDGYLYSMTNARKDVPDLTTFIQIAHSLLCIAFASVGGCIALYLHSANQADRERETSSQGRG